MTRPLAAWAGIAVSAVFVWLALRDVDFDQAWRALREASYWPLAPALVALAADEHEQADGLALSGTFRSIALLGAPATVSVLLSAVALPTALAGLAATAAAPGVVLGRGHGLVSATSAADRSPP